MLILGAGFITAITTNLMSTIVIMSTQTPESRTGGSGFLQSIFDNATASLAILMSSAVILKTVIDAIKNRGEGISGKRRSEQDLHGEVLKQNRELVHQCDSLRRQRDHFWTNYRILEARVRNDLPPDVADHILRGMGSVIDEMRSELEETADN